MGADPVVRCPVVEQRANRGDALGAVRDVGGLDLPHVRDLQARPDQQVVGRIEAIEPREPRDGGVIAPRDRRERLARAHDVDRNLVTPLVMRRVVAGDGDAVRDHVATVWMNRAEAHS